VPKLTDLVADRATVSVPFEGAALRVTYRPGAITPKVQASVFKAQRDQDLEAGLCRPLSGLLVRWDLTDDDGEPMATTPEALAELPAQLLLRVLEAITDDIAPNRTSAEASSNGSSPRAASAPAPTGTSSSS
jgi:hypothetical protein